MLSGRGASSFPAEEDCSCSICLSVLVDPVVGRCGHEFCRICIKRCPTKPDQGLPCPVCRATFAASPAELKVCIGYKNLIEHLLPDRIAERRVELEQEQQQEAARRRKAHADQRAAWQILQDLSHIQFEARQQERAQQATAPEPTMRMLQQLFAPRHAPEANILQAGDETMQMQEAAAARSQAQAQAAAARDRAQVYALAARRGNLAFATEARSQAQAADARWQSQAQAAAATSQARAAMEQARANAAATWRQAQLAQAEALSQSQAQPGWMIQGLQAGAPMVPPLPVAATLERQNAVPVPVARLERQNAVPVPEARLERQNAMLPL